MVRPSEDDRADIDRAFAEMVAGYHLTADRPDPLIDETPAAETPAASRSARDPLDRVPPRPALRAPGPRTGRRGRARGPDLRARPAPADASARRTRPGRLDRHRLRRRRRPRRHLRHHLPHLGRLARRRRASSAASDSCSPGSPATVRPAPATAQSSDLLGLRVRARVAPADPLPLPRSHASGDRVSFSGRAYSGVTRQEMAFTPDSARPPCGSGGRGAVSARAAFLASRGAGRIGRDAVCGGARRRSGRGPGARSSSGGPGRRRRSGRRRCGSGPAPAGPPRGSRDRSGSG